MLAGSFLKIAGELLDEALLQEITVRQELNSHSWCDVVCRQTMDKRFPSEELLGQELTLSAVDGEGAENELFSGFVVESELEYEVYGSQTARLRAVSQSYLMDLTPRRAYYFQKTPQDVAKELASAAGLTLAGEIEGQKLSYVQMEETDFRFLLRFVDESEKWLRPAKGGLEVRDAFQAGVKLSWRGEYGLLEFDVAGKLAACHMAGAHYDYRKMRSEVRNGIQDDPALFGSSGKMSSAAKAQASKLGTGHVTARDRLLGVDDLTPRLKKESRRSAGKMVLCRGVSREQLLRAGDQVTVDGVLDANGTYGLVSVEHRWTASGYENEFLCTPWQRYTNPDAVAVPRFDGVVAARVADNNDPEGLGRIQVQYYWQEDSFTCWIRAMTPHAGADRGVFCLPEVGDEVWVMFEEGDPERGRVMGSAWNGKTLPPREDLWGGDTAPNDVKRMVTKSGHRISLDDRQGKNAIVVATPEHVKLSLMESSNETGDAMLGLHSDGDLFLSAPAGRIHFHSKFWSREVGTVTAVQAIYKKASEMLSDLEKHALHLESKMTGYLAHETGAFLASPKKEWLQNAISRVGHSVNQKEFDGKIIAAKCETNSEDANVSELNGFRPRKCPPGKKIPKILFVNGILTKFADHEKKPMCDAMQSIADAACAEVIGVYNATEGGGADLKESLGNIARLDQAPSTLSMAKQILEAAESGKSLVIYAHSQGGLIAQEALAKVKNDLKLNGIDEDQTREALSGITVRSFGTAERGWPIGPKYSHINNFGDPVPSVIAGAQERYLGETNRDSDSSETVHIPARFALPLRNHYLKESYVPEMKMEPGDRDCNCE